MEMLYLCVEFLPFYFNFDSRNMAEYSYDRV